MNACDRCLRRAWLVGRLSGHLEVLRGEGRRVREVLALEPPALLAAVAGRERSPIAEELAAPGLAARLRAVAAGRGVTPVCGHDAGYPERLRDLHDRPAVLFVLAAEGATALSALAGGPPGGAPAVAVVGARRASSDGLEVAAGLGRGLSAAGVTVVSGMALGIDSAAHEGALAAGSRTIAVLACGADLAYPRRKAALHAAIAAGGAVVSELPPGAEPRRWAFPARNRVIAALAGLTVVVEAAERSGSLITAECAADLGRDVGAVPGPVLGWRSAGSNALLHDGAIPIRHAGDALDALLGVGHGRSTPDGGAPGPALEPLPENLAALLREVGGGRATLPALAATPEQAEATLRDLTELELLGRLRRDGGRWHVTA